MKYKFIVFCLGLILGLVNLVEARTTYHMTFMNYSDFKINMHMSGHTSDGATPRIDYGCGAGDYSINSNDHTGVITTWMNISSAAQNAYCDFTISAANDSDKQYLFGGQNVTFVILDPGAAGAGKGNKIISCTGALTCPPKGFDATSFSVCMYDDHVALVPNLSDCQQPGANTFNTNAGIVNLSHASINSSMNGCQVSSSIGSSSNYTLSGGVFSNGPITATNTVNYNSNNSCNINAQVNGGIAPVVQGMNNSVKGGSKSYNYGWQYNHGGPNNFIGTYTTASSNITPAQNFGSVCYQDDPNNPGNILTPLMATSPSQCFVQACNNNGTYVAYKYANKSSSNVISGPTSRKSYNLQPFHN
jgi:hypothetical protein